MEDKEIVDLYWQRSERAVSETQIKYEKYLYTIAFNVLSDEEDSKETVNDTYLKAWNSMPQNRPSVLSSYLGKITREQAIDCYRKRHARKREGSEYALCLDEMAETLPEKNTVESEMDMRQLSEVLSDFLKKQPENKRNIFLCRYFFMDPVNEIAARSGMNEATARSILFRMRKDLMKYLEQEGYVL